MHLVWVYLFIVKMDLGVKGAGIATSITYTTNFLIISLYPVVKSDYLPKGAWRCFDREAFRDIYPLYKYAWPATVSLCVDWWTFELTTLIAGYLPVEQLAASVLFWNLYYTCFMTT